MLKSIAPPFFLKFITRKAVGYLLLGEMQHMTVSFALPPRDSRSKCVKQDPWYGKTANFPG